MDDDFVKRLHAAALRARASGFDGVANAIEEILRDEVGPAAQELSRPEEGQSEHNRGPNID